MATARARTAPPSPLVAHAPAPGAERSDSAAHRATPVPAVTVPALGMFDLGARFDWIEFAPPEGLAQQPRPQRADRPAPRWALRGELALVLLADGLCGLRAAVVSGVRHVRTVAARALARECGS